MATAGKDAEHQTVHWLLSWDVNMTEMVLPPVIHVIRAVFRGMCPWISSWPSVELRHNYREGKGEQDNVLACQY